MKSLQKAIDVLELFLGNEDEISLSELAKSSGFNKSTVNRIAAIFVKRGYLKQIEKRGKYSLGMKFLDFSGIIKSRIKIRDIAMPYMIKLSQLAKDSVMLSVWDGRKAVFSETIPAKYPLRIIPDEGTKIPLHCTGVGKIFLADMTEPELESYFSTTKLQPCTANTITEPNQLKTHIMRIAKEGVAFDDEEYYLGVRNVSAAIKGSDGNVVAAIGVLGPSVRLTRAKLNELTPIVKSCALEISRDLGYKGD